MCAALKPVARSAVRELQLSRLGDRSHPDRPPVANGPRTARSSACAQRRSLSGGCRACCSRSSGARRDGWRAGGVRPPLRSRVDTAPRSPASSTDGRAVPDLVALVWIMKQMIDRAGSIEAVFLEGDDPAAEDVETALDSFSTRALALDLRAAYGRVRQAAGRLLFLPAAIWRERLQAAEPVPALDGAARRARSGRLDARVAGQAHRAARHARDPRRPVPAADALHEPGMAAWRATSPPRCGGSTRTIRSSTTSRCATSG